MGQISRRSPATMTVSDRLEFKLNRFIEDIYKVLGQPVSPNIFNNQSDFGRERDRLKEVFSVDDDGNKIPGQPGKRKTGRKRFPPFLMLRQLWAVYLLQSNNPQRV
eukprot:g1268.t1